MTSPSPSSSGPPVSSGPSADAPRAGPIASAPSASNKTHAAPGDLNSTLNRFPAIVARLGPTGPAALASVVLPPLGSIALYTYLNSVGEWFRSHANLGIAMYVTAFVLLAGFALLPTYASAILGGWAFGFATGFPAAMAGFTGAALVGYGLSRLAARDRVVTLIDENPKWAAVRDALVGGSTLKTFLIVTLLRVPPNSPFALTNLVLSSVKVGLVPYTLGTMIGMAPRTGAFVFFAATLQQMTAAEATKTRPWWFFVAIGVGTLAVVTVLGSLANKAVARVTGSTAKSNAAMGTGGTHTHTPA